MAVLRYQIVRTGSKSAVNKFIVIGVGCDYTHTEMRIYELDVFLV